MSIKLTSGNYKEVEFAPSGALTKDAFVAAATLGGSLNGVAFENIADATPGTIIVWAERAKATKVAADNLAFAPGEKVRYNVSGAKVSKTATDPLIGYAKKAAIAADTDVDIEFDGAVVDTANLTFAGLADVDVAGVTNNDTLKFVSSTGKWTDVAAAD